MVFGGCATSVCEIIAESRGSCEMRPFSAERRQLCPRRVGWGGVGRWVSRGWCSVCVTYACAGTLLDPHAPPRPACIRLVLVLGTPLSCPSWPRMNEDGGGTDDDAAVRDGAHHVAKWLGARGRWPRELFDPDNNTWTRTTMLSLASPRQGVPTPHQTHICA